MLKRSTCLVASVFLKVVTFIANDPVRLYNLINLFIYLYSYMEYYSCVTFAQKLVGIGILVYWSGRKYKLTILRVEYQQSYLTTSTLLYLLACVVVITKHP